MNRRAFLLASATLPFASYLRSAELPNTDPLAKYKLAWTAEVKWGNVVDVSKEPGETADDKLASAQAKLAMQGGGVAFFPAGVYRFSSTIKLLNGVVLRGTDPLPVTSAQNEKYAPPTQFEFPKYEFQPEGDGTPISKAFKGIQLAEPGVAANVGLVNIALNRTHIHFYDDGPNGHAAGSNRFVVGCVLRNCAVADNTVPNLKINQLGWQRFTSRHHAAIDIKAKSNILIANNRLPKSGEDNFSMSGYVLLDTKKMPTKIDGVVFDYDNRPAMYVNHFGIGGSGGSGPDGTPKSHPHGFRKGIIIRDNYIYNTGRIGIGFCGEGVQCLNNVIRFPDDVWRPTATGQQLTSGASTNDNRAMEMRGWGWVLDGNDYIVHRNWAYDKKYKINDGEGLMHEDHMNSTVKDSILVNNRGNAYLSIYKTAGVDGLLIEGNEIRLPEGKQTIAAIYVNADRNKGRFPVKRVKILKNVVSGGGILLSGDPSEENVIKGNKFAGQGQGTLNLNANADLDSNEGFTVKKG
jgi:hypothetical protein